VKSNTNESLPRGWSMAKLGDVLPLSYGKSLVEEKRDSSGTVPVFGSSGLVGHHSSALVDKPTLIIGRKGNVGAVFHSEVPCWVIDTAYFVANFASVYLSFFRYLIAFLQLGRLDRSTAVPGLSRNDYNELIVPVPPENEQRRIVAEIEKQFTRLDAAVAALKRIQANLKRYRAAVLKAACEGRLVPTEAELARREGRSYEPASVLLERILADRRSRWEAVQNNGKKSNYKDPRSLELSILPSLSEGWEWASLGSIAELKGGLTKGQKRKPTDKVREVPYLRVANVQRGYLDLNEIKTIDATPGEIDELRLVDGDVLFNEGGDRDKLGRGWVWEGKIHECVHQNHVFRARLAPDTIQPKFLSWYGNSMGRRYLEDEGKQTTNLASLNMTKLSMLPVPIPPVAEQKRIVSELERRLSVIDEMEAEVNADMRRSERLRQGILKHAFEGKLAPQDSKDDPASSLLERIHAEQPTKPITLQKKNRRLEVAHGH